MSQQRFPQTAGRMAERSVVAASAANPRLALMRGLACPACSRDLEIEFAATGAAPSGLACRHCGRQWPVRQRTPAFLPPSPEDAIPSGALALLHAPDVERWDAFSHSIEQANPALHAEVFDSSRDDWRFLLPLPPRARVLVIGCGWGRLASSFAGISGSVYAVDRDEARARFVNVRAFAEEQTNLLAVAAGIGGLPFPRGAFDLVVLGDVGALGPKGGGTGILPSLVRLRAFLAPGGFLLLPNAPVTGHRRRRAGPRAWGRLLQRAGFTCSESLLALPDSPACSHALRDGSDAGTGPALRAFARNYVRPKSAVRRALWKLATALPLPAASRRLMPAHWCLAGGGDHPTPAVLMDTSLPTGPWSILVARGRANGGGFARFIAVDPETACPRFVVKVARDDSESTAVDREYRILEYLHETLSPGMRRTIPCALAHFRVHGHPAVAQTHLGVRTLLSLLLETPPARRTEVAVELLAASEHWLARFHHETSREAVLTGDLLNDLLLDDLERVMENNALPDQAHLLWSEAADAARAWVGRKVPLVCEHGDYRGGSILVDSGTVGVVGWDLAARERLPLGDLFDLVHSIAFVLAGEGRDGESVGEMLRIAYGGRGSFSCAVGLAIDAYCLRVGIRPEWTQVLLPLLMAHRAWTAALNPRPGAPQQWLGIGMRFLQAPTRFPVALGVRRHETPKGWRR